MASVRARPAWGLEVDLRCIFGKYIQIQRMSNRECARRQKIRGWVDPGCLLRRGETGRIASGLHETSKRPAALLATLES